MPAPLLKEIREKIISKYMKGFSVKIILEHLELKNLSSIYNIIKLYTTTGSLEPKPLNNGRKPMLDDSMLLQIEDKIKEKPDITLEDLKAELNLPVCISALCRTINNKLNLHLKKKTLFPENQNRPDVAEARKEWSENIKNLDFSKLVFLDESSINLGMTRLYGRGKEGERVNDYVPDVRFHRQSILSTIRLNGEMVPLVFSGTLNSDIFKEYITNCLVPTLSEGDIVVMDNLSSHKVVGVVDPILACGATVLYLPSYSPDLNPIELKWSKVKTFLRKIRAKTLDLLESAIKQSLSLVSSADISSWFRHCGYSKC